MESLNQLISSLAIPHKTGTITRREHASGDVTGLLVCIQDLHANPGVQINEAKIILHLVANYRFSVVLVEGATGQGDLSILCSLPPAIRRRFMRNLMRRAYLTGSEYAGALDPDADFDLWGIDDSHGYRQNWMAAVRTDVVRDKVSHAAASFRSNILRACRPYVSPDLWDLFELRTKFRSGLRDATKSDLAGRLLLYSTAYSVAVPPSIRRWMDLHGEMHANRGRDGQTPLDPLEEPNLPLESFFSDVAKAVAESVGGSDARFDQCFLFLLDAVDLAENAFQLNLQRPEAMRFLAFDARRLRDRVRDSVTWMNSKISESAEHVEVPPAFEAVFDNWEMPRIFYKSAMERSDSMLENVAAQLQRRRIDRAVFVSGGFHTSYIVDNLARRYGLGSVVVTPHVDALDDRSYRARMKEHLRLNTPQPPAEREPLWLRLWLWAESVRRQFVQPVEDGLRRLAEGMIDRELSSLRGTETILFSGCADSGLFINIARRLKTGLVIAHDRFDFHMGGHLVEWRSVVPTLKAVQTSGCPGNITVLNMILQYINCRDGVLDVVVCPNFDHIVRGYEQRKAIREIERTLKENGTLILYGAGRSKKHLSLLTRSGRWNIRWYPVSFLSRKAAVIVAHKRSQAA